MATTTLAIASGKGGVGKSVLALNLAVALGRYDRRVLLVDADLGLGNIAILSGLNPEHTLEDLLLERCSTDDAVVEGPEGVAILPAAVDMEAEFWTQAKIDAGLGARLQPFEAQYDFILVDTGAGIAAKSLDFAVAADEVLLLVTPEPTAIADAYASLKMLLHRHRQQRVGLLVNMADSAAEAAELHEKFQEIAARFLGAEIDNRGYIPLDRYVREAVKRQVPFVLATPPSPAAEAVSEMAGWLLQRGDATEKQHDGLFVRALRNRE